MKIAILSQGPRLYSTRRLREAAENRGHKVRVLDPLKFSLDVERRNLRRIRLCVAPETQAPNTIFYIDSLAFTAEDSIGQPVSKCRIHDLAVSAPRR